MSKWAVRILRDKGVVEELGTVEAPNHGEVLLNRHQDVQRADRAGKPDCS
jgi:hypothetical protein